MLLARHVRRLFRRLAKYPSLLGIFISFPAILARVLITCYTIDTRWEDNDESQSNCDELAVRRDRKS